MSYTDAVTRAVPKIIDGIPVRVISLDDLIANKKASGRAKDLADAGVKAEDIISIYLTGSQIVPYFMIAK